MTTAEFIRRAAAKGWTVTRLARHLQLTHPLAERAVTMAATPSDWRAYANVLAEMRRALPAPPPKLAREKPVKVKPKPAPRRRAAPLPAPAPDRRPAPPAQPPYRRPIPGGPAGYRSSWSWL